MRLCSALQSQINGSGGVVLAKIALRAALQGTTGALGKTPALNCRCGGPTHH
jgi:hypothetical protein